MWSWSYCYGIIWRRERRWKTIGFWSHKKAVLIKKRPPAVITHTVLFLVEMHHFQPLVCHLFVLKITEIGLKSLQLHCSKTSQNRSIFLQNKYVNPKLRLQIFCCYEPLLNFKAFATASQALTWYSWNIWL